MSLLEELKEKLQTVCAEQDEQLAKIRVHEAFLGAAMQDIRDLSRAIAALEPSAVEGSSVAAYFDARRAEALLDPQPEAASPEFASDQDKALQSKLDQFLQQPFALLWGGGVEAPPGLDPHHLVEVVTRGNVLRTRAVKEFQWLSGHAPTNPEDDIIAYRPLATWDEVIQHHVHAHQHEPKPGDLDRAAAKLEDDPLAATMLQEAMDSGHADGPRIPDAERTSDESQAEDPTIDALVPPQIPEGFIPWSGGECPVSKDQVVELLFRESWAGDGSGRAIYISDPADYADLTQWKHHGQGGDIIAYRVVESPTYAERTEDVSQAETATEQTLITDDIPSIPREEIPIGAAVETYTDSGIETVKISGTTYVVDDEPVAEASYAPINSEPASDALMWSNGFEADAKSKAEPEQDKRPFWTRAPNPR